MRENHFSPISVSNHSLGMPVCLNNVKLHTRENSVKTYSTKCNVSFSTENINTANVKHGFQWKVV